MCGNGTRLPGRKSRRDDYGYCAITSLCVMHVVRFGRTNNINNASRITRVRPNVVAEKLSNGARLEQVAAAATNARANPPTSRVFFLTLITFKREENAKYYRPGCRKRVYAHKGSVRFTKRETFRLQRRRKLKNVYLDGGPTACII